MTEKRYRVTINQSIEVQAKSKQKAKEYVAEDILDFIDWRDVEITELRER